LRSLDTSSDPAEDNADDKAVAPYKPDRRWFRLVRKFRARSNGGDLLAIAILSAEGYRLLRRFGHDSVAIACDPDITPRRVRLLDPEQTKDVVRASSNSLRAIFSAPRPSHPIRLGTIARADSEASLSLRVPPDLRSIEGHFDRMPIVPGAVQIGWAIHHAAEAFKITRPRLAGLNMVKFRRVLQPGHQIELSLHWHAPHSTLSFRIDSGLGVHTSGRILLRHHHG